MSFNQFATVFPRFLSVNAAYLLSFFTVFIDPVYHVTSCFTWGFVGVSREDVKQSVCFQLTSFSDASCGVDHVVFQFQGPLCIKFLFGALSFLWYQS